MNQREREITQAEINWNTQRVTDRRCGWCLKGLRHMRDEHASAIATYKRLFRQ